MTDVETPKGRRAEGIGLLAELTAIDGEVDAGARELEALVKLGDLPDGPSLSAARLRFSRALRRHLQFVDAAVMPYLQATVDAKADQTVGDYRRLLNATTRRRRIMSRHGRPSAWPPTGAVTDGRSRTCCPA